MALILDIMPDVLVTIMGILGLIRAKRFQNAFSAIAALFGVDEIRLYSDVELFVGQHWDDIFAALDVHARGRQYFVCRLAHCDVPDREFETVAAWRKHVALARSHLEDAFCGTCGHHLIVPPEIDRANIKAFITAHKKERCIAASNATVRQRRTEVAWLDGLMRTSSHILVPG
uniref:Mut7-C domain-containing protein n=1 Tax=Ascaris lumbricoides TaxID=6252 RepID=A0A0M3I1S4_ASCLU